MVLPPRLEKILETDDALNSTVLGSLASYERWLLQSRTGMPFFPEFTDHGILHLQQVIGLTDIVIGNQSYDSNQITPQDVGILVAAVLTHDCAMHFSEDNFLSLLNGGKASTIMCPSLDKSPWPELWEEYLEEAKKWNQRMLLDTFGNSLDSSVTRPLIRRPPDDQRLWDGIDRRLIGEFLRRHHPRLAHEIAVGGFPVTVGSNPLQLAADAPSIQNWYPDLAGLVARSHGMAMRETFDYLTDKYSGKAEVCGAHPVFLMAVLRIADFLHLHAERAPSDLSKLQVLQSPLSKLEWDSHDSIAEVRLDPEGDPEGVLVRVDPLKLRDVGVLLRVKEWVAGLQSQLDQCWAVLGEVYGRHERLKGLTLSIRRVMSNVLRPDFSHNLKFVAVDGAFRTAEAELLKLLVRPLYGDRPEIGIRELVQNAVDAVLERRGHERADPSRPACDGSIPPFEADVLVAIKVRSARERVNDDVPSHWRNWVEVLDCGIGMTAETVVNYFLRAGASFRDSPEWHQMFDNAEGRSRVLRSGRFGIGLLAAFLLGEEIQVSTRYVRSEEGVRFTACIGTRHITLFRVSRPIGTTVRVSISDVTRDRLSKAPAEWDWYGLADPKAVRISWQDGLLPLPKTFAVPLANAELPADFRRISHPEFRDIQWTYSPGPRLVVNGIQVVTQNAGPRPHWRRRHASVPSAELPFELPNVSVFDGDRKLELNLQRTNLVRPYYPFDDELLTDVVRDFLAYCLVRGPSAPPCYETPSRKGEYVGYASPFVRNVHGHSWFYTKSGFSFLDPYLIDWAGVRTAFCFSPFQYQEAFPRVNTDGYDAAFVIWANGWPLDVGGWSMPPHSSAPARAVFETTSTSPFSFFCCDDGRCMVQTKVARREEELPIFASRRKHGLEVRFRNDSWTVYGRGNKVIENSPLDELLSAGIPEWSGILAEWKIARRCEPLPLTPLAQQWKTIFGTAVLPFDLSQRRFHFSAAFERLSEYIKRWE